MTTTQMTAAAAGIRWITPKEAAFMLRVGTRTLWRLTLTDGFPQPIRLSRKLVRFSLADVTRWMQAQEEPRGKRPPRDACQECGGPLWSCPDQDGDGSPYCPDCTRYETADA